MKDLDSICLMGEKLLSATFDDTKPVNEEYEREWFLRNQKVGFKWSPPRMEARLLYKQLSGEIDYLRKRLSFALCWMLGNAVLTCVLAWLIVRS